MPDTTMTMHSIDDNTGGSLGVMRHTGGVYLVIDDEGRTAAAGPFTRAQLDGLLDELEPVGRSTGPHVHYEALGGYKRRDDYLQGGLVQALPESFRRFMAERDERERLGRLVEQAREDGCPVQVDRVKIAPCDTRGRTRDEVALQLQLDQEKKRHIATEQDRDELVDVQRHLTAHRAFAGCTDEDRPLLPAMLDRLDTLMDAEQPQLPTDADVVPDHMIMVMLDALGARQPGKRVGQHSALLVQKLRRGIAALATARSDEDTAADRLRALLDAYHGQDIHAVDHEGRMSVFLARHGARVEEGR